MGWYKGWRISYDPKPIPVRDFDWIATSPDYDCDCDEDGFFRSSGEQVNAAHHWQITAEIDAAIEAMTPAPQGDLT